MAIWGSLIGGMIGFSLGGPFGMLLGSLIANAIGSEPILLNFAKLKILKNHKNIIKLRITRGE